MSSKPRNRCQKTTWTACRKQAVFFPSPGCHPLLKRAGCSRTVRRYLTISMEIFLILKASAFSANPGRHKKKFRTFRPELFLSHYFLSRGTSDQRPLFFRKEGISRFWLEDLG